MAVKEYVAPEVKESIGRIDFDWETLELLVSVSRIADKGTAELWFYHKNGTGTSLLHTAQVNLLSTTTVNSVVKRMEKHSETIPWEQVLTQVSSTTMEYQRRGEPSTVIRPISENIQPPDYFVEPLIMKGVPSVIFGDKGVNKTTVALALLGLVSSGCDDSSTGLIGKDGRVGMLDWESNADLTSYTTSRLVAGRTVPYFELPYLRCKQSLTDDIERIANFIQQEQIEVALIDSLGQAAGSDKFDTTGKSVALQFFEVLRQLNLTTLIIAQNSKGDEGKKTIFGSTFYTYYSRNIFELKKATEGEQEVQVALVHQEGNYSQKAEPLGFKIKYSPTTISMVSESVDIGQFKDKINDIESVIQFLKLENKPCTVKAIASAIDKNENRTRVILSTLKKRSQIVNPMTGLWALPAKQHGNGVPF